MTMTTRTALLALAVSFGLAVPSAVRADDSKLSYDDPAVHFSAPDGWQQQNLPPEVQQGAHYVAAFTKTFDRNDTRTITLRIEPYAGTLNGLQGSHESDLRGQADNVFVDKKTRITLANGMPAWLMKVSIGQDPGRTVRDFEYVVFDGRRSIIASYVGRDGTFDDKEAISALSTLSVVLYPAGR
jgi:hypothetical protein